MRFPRTRGDGPLQGLIRNRPTQFPPHARGWTREGQDLRVGWRVSPARAGMDRLAWAARGVSSGFPRTRGDGPAPWLDRRFFRSFPPHARGWTGFRAEIGGSRLASPHARGWTVFSVLFAHSIVASPARAGMDLHPKFQTKKV